MSYPQQIAFLKLADGAGYGLQADDDASAALLNRMATIMRLSPTGAADWLVLVRNEGNRFTWEYQHPYGSASTCCRIGQSHVRDIHPAFMLPVAGTLAMTIEHGPRLFVHAGLAVIRGQGVLLAGASGIGKSTAIRRLPDEWQGCCDDAVLIVFDSTGQPLAHPWPTWSELILPDAQNTWIVERHVPLKAVCLLEQAEMDGLTAVPPVEATIHINALCEELHGFMLSHLSTESLANHRRHRLDTIIRLVHRVPCFMLKISRHGAFWNLLTPMTA